MAALNNLTPEAMTNEGQFTRSRSIIPGGVNSPVRAFGSVGGTPRFIASAQGAYVRDITGREYVDLVCSWGPALLGHAHPEVVAAVTQAASKGLSFGAPTVGESELAEAIAARVRAGGVSPLDRVRLVSTGTEATMTAIRLARGFTDRPLIIKFAGHYHGHSDGLLAESGSGVATLALPGSAGIPQAVAAQTIVLPYSYLVALQAAFDTHPGRIAAVITEAAGANAGVLAPHAEFNAALVQMAHQAGALVILDEVLTGFRVGTAGWWGLEASGVTGSTGWQPDLLTFGKVIGGGMPLAALGGRAEVMDLLAPLGPVYQAGTLSGNPLAVAAGLATLRLADDAVYAPVNAVATTIADALEVACEQAGLQTRVSRAGNLFSLAFRSGTIENYDDARSQEGWRYPAFFASMLDHGVTLPPSVFEAWFVSAAHDETAVGRILEALPAAAKAAASAIPPESGR